MKTLKQIDAKLNKLFQLKKEEDKIIAEFDERFYDLDVALVYQASDGYVILDKETYECYMLTIENINRLISGNRNLEFGI
ncbi:MAG: hypothetical protein KBG61_11105 [Flavobacterium sp.]|nr:hypothetical protein [Flavobacterium sp.]